MLKVCLILISLALTSGALRAQAPSGVMSSDSSAARNRAWRADLQYLATELPKRHKNLFFKIPRQDFAREVARLDEAIPSMQDFEVKIGFIRLAAMVGDNHTGVAWRREDFGTYPVQFYSYSGGWYVTAAAEEYRRVLGSRLIRIGDMDIDSAAATLRSLIACENDSCFRHLLQYFLNVPEFLYAQRILPDAERGQFTFEDKTGERFSLEIRAVAPQQWRSVQWTPLPLPQVPREQTLWRLNRNVNYWYEYVANSKTLYFAYNLCRDSETQPFKEFARELLAFADSHPIERFVIDMRRNGGGSEALLLPFIAELSRRPAINRRGRLFVIVGRGTFSSAAQNALRLKQNTQATIVGEPTGQKPNHYGQVRTFRLPNSGLDVNYSTVFWKLVDGDPPAFIPDILVEHTFADFSSGRDAVLAAILNFERSDIQKKS